MRSGWSVATASIETYYLVEVLSLLRGHLQYPRQLHLGTHLHIGPVRNSFDDSCITYRWLTPFGRCLPY